MNNFQTKNILLYCSFNQRSVHIESIASEVKKAGQNLMVLTTCERGDLHFELEKLGVEVYSKAIKKDLFFFYWLKHIRCLVSFCKKRKIDTVWSQLQDCNFIAVFAQYFIKARVITFRHHFHAIIKTEGLRAVNKNELFIGKIVSRLAKEIVVPSTEVRQGMIEYERVSPAKISIVPYIYNFDLYENPDAEAVKKIRAEYPAKLLILVASRMIKMKRHALVMPVFKKLLDQGYDIKVLLLDKGEEMNNLRDFVSENDLAEKIFFLGFQKNIINYLSAVDLLVHPSYTEASSSLVKELGLVHKPVIVCKGVGDFDEYIVHGKNGLVVAPPDEASHFEEYIKIIYREPELAKKIGDELYHSVKKMFSANSETIERYLEIA